MYPGAVELRLLRYVVVVAEELSFTRAAARLNTSQPSLSRQIRQLECDLGVELFRRTKRWVELTQPGKRFVEEAKKALVHAKKAVQAAEQLGREGRESFTIGYCEFVDLDFLAALRRMRLPGDVQVIYRSASYEELVAKLLIHEWEAAVTVLPVSEDDLVSEPLLRENLVAALPLTHPLAKKRTLAATDLRDQTVVLSLRCFGPAFRNQLLRSLDRAGLRLPVTHEAANPHEALHMVRNGLGITLGQQSVLALAREHVAVRTISDFSAEVETGIVLHRENDSKVVRALVEGARRTRDSYLRQRGRELPISA